MDSFEMNKILGAILGTLPGVAGDQHRRRRDLRARQAGQARLRHRGAGAEAGAGGADAPAQEQQQPIEQLLASADVERGENAAKKCAACHTFDKGGRPLVGPNLWGVVGRPKASRAGLQLFGRR